ncbi:MAG: DUF2283 domain-containing protein [Chloroflexi bacterium]|nr:DUF2283 domain-containing protein [Chloroflexota bacterium]
MKISYDAKVDALYIEFHPLAPGTAENKQLTDEVIANYDPNGKLAGLEILDASVVLAQKTNESSLVFQVQSLPAVAMASR